jgi:hypothetical protein
MHVTDIDARHMSAVTNYFYKADCRLGLMRAD